MLASLVDEPFSRPGWIFEEKYDGVRMVTYKEGSKISMISRNDIDRANRYPEIVADLKTLKADTLVLDGEVVVFDPKKVSRFQLLQRGQGRPLYAIFDCLFRDGKDLRQEPLYVRHQQLEQVLKPSGTLFLSRVLASNGLKAFQIASKRGMEGIIAKNLESKYVASRSREWLKVKTHQEQEFVIGGFTEPAGARHRFGALLLGLHSRGKLQFVGKVGTGFDEKTLESLYQRLRKTVQKSSPFANEVRERAATFVKPVLVAQISFAEWTHDKKLRQPVYLGLRDDKPAKEVVGEIHA